jgi:multiple sugar transport system substrate-binding protein
MKEIEFSVMEGRPGASQKLLPLLEDFEREHQIHVNLKGISWTTGWSEIAKFGIFGHGPDVSCIGSTWIGSLAAMRAIRTFNQQQIRALGGEDAFFPSLWNSMFLSGRDGPYGIPWLGDVMVFYCLKDAMSKAGIQDTQAAFSTDAAFVDTLNKLQKVGYKYPLSLTTTGINPVILHEAAHWLWTAGGEFISNDARSVAFTQPAAMQGWRNYFSLQPYISPESLGVEFVGDLFLTGKSVVHLGGPAFGTVTRKADPKWGGNLNTAPVPGITFVGGASLVVWNYSRRVDEAFELIRFLSAKSVRIPASPHGTEVSTLREALNLPSVKEDIFHRTALQSLQTGRSFPTTRLWGSIEEKIVVSIRNIWLDLFANPGQDLDACIHKHLDPLANSLNTILNN